MCVHGPLRKQSTLERSPYLTLHAAFPGDQVDTTGHFYTNSVVLRVKDAMQVSKNQRVQSGRDTGK